MKKPRILFFDIETKPVRFWAWRTGKQYLNHEQIVDGERFDIICICYKWDHESKIHSLDWGIHAQDSSDMIRKFKNIAESADIVIAHNADNFDIKQINTQRLIKGMSPIDWPQSQDTLKALRKYFYLPSNRLDYVSKLLLGTGKNPMSFPDWIDIVQNKKASALSKMIKYCKKDVKLLADAYLAIEPFLKPKVHVGMFNGHHKNLSCARCGSLSQRSNGFRGTATGRVRRIRCMDCGKSATQKA